MSVVVETDISKEIKELEEQLQRTKSKLVELRKERSGEEIRDYELMRPDGTRARISELFGNKDDLI
ncbi:MAG: hypothetical protein ACE5GA_08480, partial [Candidatus Zixiibacteriota bacterium]